MPSTLLPFLYQTRTLQRALYLPCASHLARLAHSSQRPKTRKRDNSIPFDWGSSSSASREDSAQSSTITPAEAKIFKGIFEEIAQGKIPPAKTPLQKEVWGPSANKSKSASLSNLKRNMARSIVEEARATQFRERFLRRFPQSLRDAAQVALGLYELKPEDGGFEGSQGSHKVEMIGGNQHVLEERLKYDLERARELERVHALMESCDTDEALWKVLEEEVFSLPGKLGILQSSSKSTTELEGEGVEDMEEELAALENADEEAESEEPIAETEEEKRIMDIHGPLYSQFISFALGLFETGFAHPSPYSFQILPRVKELGLPSYVLGVSTPFYSRLAKMHWERFGDANFALDALREMNAVGLYADRGVKALLGMMRDHLHGCALGDQGDFVMGMMQSPPYDGALMQKLNDVERAIRLTLYESTSG